MEQQGDTLQGMLIATRFAQGSSSVHGIPPHLTDGHPEVSVTQLGLQLTVSTLSALWFFILPATLRDRFKEKLASTGNFNLKMNAKLD